MDEPGRVVAIVNGMPVMEIDFHWAIQQARETSANGLVSKEMKNTQQLKEEGMTALIRGAILLQEAKKRDIDATATSCDCHPEHVCPRWKSPICRWERRI